MNINYASFMNSIKLLHNEYKQGNFVLKKSKASFECYSCAKIKEKLCIRTNACILCNYLRYSHAKFNPGLQLNYDDYKIT